MVTKWICKSSKLQSHQQKFSRRKCKSFNRVDTICLSPIIDSMLYISEAKWIFAGNLVIISTYNICIRQLETRRELAKNIAQYLHKIKTEVKLIIIKFNFIIQLLNVLFNNFLFNNLLVLNISLMKSRFNFCWMLQIDLKERDNQIINFNKNYNNFLITWV